MFSSLWNILGFHGTPKKQKCETDASSLGFLEFNDFENRILEERCRTDRSGLPFTVVVLTVPQINHIEKREEEWKNLLIRIVSQRVRQCDSKGFYSRDQKQIGMILPNTRWEDSLVLIQSLEEIFNARLKSHARENSDYYELQCEVFSYPSDLIKQALPSIAHQESDEPLSGRLSALKNPAPIKSSEKRIA
ncbi:MAG: hypothetical protein JXR73_15600 [Candidatus Omnitrophica bacterium]|nr:hypothetical protein [Candidatus Omnitrophota bacterium]